MCICICTLFNVYNDCYMDTWTSGPLLRSVSEISSCFFGPRPWHIEIRHRVKKTSTMNLFGFETLTLKIRRLKLWKPTVLGLSHATLMSEAGYHYLLFFVYIVCLLVPFVGSRVLLFVVFCLYCLSEAGYYYLLFFVILFVFTYL